jgi:hypothetical protein
MIAPPAFICGKRAWLGKTSKNIYAERFFEFIMRNVRDLIVATLKR